MALVALSSCNTFYENVSLKRISDERKSVARNFAETFFSKCHQKDYTPITGFNISKRFEPKLVADSLMRSCQWIEKKLGTDVQVDQLTSVRSPRRPADFVDVFTFALKREKDPKPIYLHLGMYRDQNFVELPFYFSSQENYFVIMHNKYRKKKK